MNALHTLLGPLTTTRDASAVRTLIIDGDVPLHICEDESRAEIALYCHPGCVPVRQIPEVPGRMWVQALPHRGHPEARALLAVEAQSRRLFLAEVWPRRAMDRVTFGERIRDLVRQHHLWQEALDPPMAWQRAAR